MHGWNFGVEVMVMSEALNKAITENLARVKI
jgi:hypothetical protein